MALNQPRGRNGGRPSSWRSPTKMIRLPEKYEAQIIEYAKKLDSESESSEQDQAVVLRGHIEAIVLSLPPGDRRVANRLFKKLLRRYEDQEQGK